MAEITSDYHYDLGWSSVRKMKLSKVKKWVQSLRYPGT